MPRAVGTFDVVAVNAFDEQLKGRLDPITADWDERPGLRPAAVLVPIQHIDAHDTLLLIRRTDTMSNHAGQIAFPGGGREGPETPAECALRESHEELGLDPAAVTLLGSIPPRVSHAGYVVHVVVGRIDADFEAVPDPREVASFSNPRIEDLADRDQWDWREVARVNRPLPHFELDSGTLWGLTARFTFDLLERSLWT